MRITINTVESDVAYSYAEVVRRAGRDSERLYSVTWHSADGRFTGRLVPGEVIQLYEGMRFNVSETEPEFGDEELPTKDVGPKVGA